MAWKFATGVHDRFNEASELIQMSPFFTHADTAIFKLTLKPKPTECGVVKVFALHCECENVNIQVFLRDVYLMMALCASEKRMTKIESA